MKSAARGAIVVVAICSWFGISNHCAFAALATHSSGCQPGSHHRQGADATGCPFHSKPANQKKRSPVAPCCKVLRAISSVPTKSWARDDAKSFHADRPRGERALTFAYCQAILVPLSFDTGPPGLRSFAELILQRSLLAHAPPIAA